MKPGSWLHRPHFKTKTDNILPWDLPTQEIYLALALVTWLADGQAKATSVLSAAHLPASTGPVNHHLQKQSHPGPRHKSSQLDRMGTSNDELHGNIAQEATFWSKTAWRPQGGVSEHWESSQDSHTEKLTTEHPPAMYVPQSLLRFTKTPL